MDIVFTAQSKRFFYCRDAVCQYVFDRNHAPVNPFRAFEYFLSDRVDRDRVREANNALVLRADQLWVFGQELADGVLAEVQLAAQNGKPIRFFSIDPSPEKIRELDIAELKFEREVLSNAGTNKTQLLSDLTALVGRVPRVVQDPLIGMH
jgi:hypothetical protein